MDIISYGDMIPPGTYCVHSAFENAINFRKGRFMVSLVTPKAGAGPVNIVIRRLPKGTRTFRASHLYFYLDENRLVKRPEAAYDSHVPAVETDAPGLERNLEALKAALLRRGDRTGMAFIFSPSPEKFFRRGFEQKLYSAMKQAVSYLRGGAYGVGARKLKGLGIGLTPSGDDFLCGILAGFAFAKVSLSKRTGAKADILYRNALGRNLISNSFLKCSYDGRVTAKVRRLMLALAGEGRLESAAADALETGHTSGADFCAGMIFALEDVLKFEKAVA